MQTPQHNSKHSHVPRGFLVSQNAALPIPSVIPSSIHTPNKLLMNRVSVCPKELPSPLPRAFLHDRRLHQHLIHTSPEKPLLIEQRLHGAGGGNGRFWCNDLAPLMRGQCSGTVERTRQRQAVTGARGHPADTQDGPPTPGTCPGQGCQVTEHVRAIPQQ